MSGNGRYGTTHRALVREVPTIGVGVIVEIPALAQAAMWGPIPTAIPDLAVGEQVLVQQLGVRRDELAVIGRLPGRAPTAAEIPGLDAALADRALAVDLDALATELRAADAALAATDDELALADAALSGRLDTAETTLGDHGGRITTLEEHVHPMRVHFHHGGGTIGVVPGSTTSFNNLFHFDFTAQVAGSYALVGVWLNAYCSAGGAPPVGAVSQTFCHLDLLQGGVSLHNEFLLEMATYVMENGTRPRTQPYTLLRVPVALTPGLTYTIRVQARRDPSMTRFSHFQGWNCTVIESGP